VDVTGDSRHEFSDYISSYDRPREYIMTLKIRKINTSDFGLYRCTVSDSYGRADAEVQLAIASIEMPNEKPPDTPLDCCEARGVEKRCLSMCGASETADKRYIPRPFMPKNCSVQISKVLSCAMPVGSSINSVDQ
jgi:hypothetical protein